MLTFFYRNKAGRTWAIIPLENYYYSARTAREAQYRACKQPVDLYGTKVNKRANRKKVPFLEEKLLFQSEHLTKGGMKIYSSKGGKALKSFTHRFLW